jgi:DNA-binding Lrp family transcriptional regulator
MSGGCDLSVVVTGKTFREVSAFVSKELATIDAVTATSTQFIMKRYKDYGVLLTDEEKDERDAVSL